MWSLCTSVWGNIARSSCRSCEESTTSHQRTTLTSSARKLNCWIKRTNLFLTSATGWMGDWWSSWRLQNRSRCWMKQLEVQKVAVTKKSEACNILLKDISEKQGAWRGETNYGTGIYVYIRCRRALSSCYTNTFHYCSMSLIYTKFNAKEYAWTSCIWFTIAGCTSYVLFLLFPQLLLVLFSSWANHETSLLLLFL